MSWRRPSRQRLASSAMLALLTLASVVAIDEVSAVRFGLRPKREMFEVHALHRNTIDSLLVHEKELRKDTPMIASLSTVSKVEAQAYLKASQGDEIAAAYELARHRNMLDGAKNPPDDTEVHHALFLLRRALGLTAPSFDSMRFELRRRVAA